MHIPGLVPRPHSTWEWDQLQDVHLWYSKQQEHFKKPSPSRQDSGISTLSSISRSDMQYWYQQLISISADFYLFIETIFCFMSPCCVICTRLQFGVDCLCAAIMPLTPCITSHPVLWYNQSLQCRVKNHAYSWPRSQAPLHLGMRPAPRCSHNLHAIG